MDWFHIVEVADWLRDFGIWAILVSLLLNILISILGVVPSLFLSGANAVVFGIITGFWISLLGEVLGAAVSFWLYRFGSGKVNLIRNKAWKWHRTMNQASRGKRWVGLLIARLTPFLPSGLITFAASISQMSFWDFLIATILGKAPSIALETLVGHDLILIHQNFPRLILSLLFIAALFLIFRQKIKIKA